MNRFGKMGLLLGVLALGATACESKPDPVQVHRAKGTKAFNRKDYKTAVEEYEKSLQADPKQEKIWETKAIAHMQLGETEEAVQSSLKLLDFKTTPAEKVEVYRNVAGIYMKGGPLEKAEEYFNKALELDPKDEASLGWLAEIYSQRGGARSMSAPVVTEHLDKSLAYYDQVIALNPNSANTYLNKRIVMAKYMEHERKQAMDAESEAVENAKKPDIVKEAKARAAEHTARVEQFKAQFDELTKKFSEATKANAAAAAAAPAPAAPAAQAH
jgi:tetratricopeptide (TPR) repeat protein